MVVRILLGPRCFCDLLLLSSLNMKDSRRCMVRSKVHEMCVIKYVTEFIIGSGEREVR